MLYCRFDGCLSARLCKCTLLNISVAWGAFPLFAISKHYDYTLGFKYTLTEPEPEPTITWWVIVFRLILSLWSAIMKHFESTATMTCYPLHTVYHLTRPSNISIVIQETISNTGLTTLMDIGMFWYMTDCLAFEQLCTMEMLQLLRLTLRWIKWRSIHRKWIP